VVNGQKHAVHQYGELNVPGNGPDKLNAPYAAFVIGDYMGQTPPPGMGDGR